MRNKLPGKHDYMEIVVDHKDISTDERAQISQQVKAELIEHLYRGCLPGTISGIPVGIAIFVDFFGHTSTYLLLAWAAYYCFALIQLTGLYFFYQRNKNNFKETTWLVSYSIAMSLCAVAWGVTAFLMPDTAARQFVACLALIMIAAGYATGSIGIFRLCVVTLTLIMMPLVVWCLIQGSFLYNLIASFTSILYCFLLGINHRSTQWFKESLALKLENTLVSYQANHDLLTDLPNQRLLPMQINSAIEFVKHSNDTFALVCFSLNRLEMINDSMGHQAGNEIIHSVANRLKALAAKAGKDATQYIINISRKDTFNILVVPIKFEDSERNIKALFSVLDEPFYLEQKGVKMTASLGASIYGRDGHDTQSLQIGAEAAMLQAKQFGGNRLEFYRQEINAQTPKQVELETDLHEAIKKNQLLLHYQPLIDLRTGKISGMEALIRWKHPTHGFISPINFIPLAEETGLIIPIGEWVLKEACKQTKIWHEMGYSTLRVAVNLSEKQLRDENNIITTIERVLKTTGFDSRFLELEITETAMLDESVVHLIKEFKKMGLSLAVDDFGTGYSGLSYLKRFEIDKLKIDQSFVRDIPGSNDSVTIVSAIIAMAKELKVNTLAEGVETEEQLNFLKEKGCDYIQGYYFSKPLDTQYFTQFLLNYKSLPTKEGMKQ